MELLNKIKALDAYPKLNEEFKVKTFGGAVVSVCALVIILLLLFSELSLFLSVERVDHLFVDVSRGEKLRINFDVTFPHIPCSLLSLDAMDVSGSHQLDVNHHIKKKPIDSAGNPVGVEVQHRLEAEQPAGGSSPPAVPGQIGVAGVRPGSTPTGDITKDPNYCGSCYGAESYPGQCCRTCDDVKEQYRIHSWAMPALATVEQCVASGQTVDPVVAELEQKQGCEMYGYLEVNKVAGNFHFAPGKSFQHQHLHVHDLAAYQSTRFNVSHIIHSLSFGEAYPGQVNPLDDVKKQQPPMEASLPNTPLSELGGMFMYYIKIVPTTYSHFTALTTTQTNQYSVTEHYRATSAKDGQGLPGVFFFYELSPIMVSISERRQGLLHFLTQLCAILGGVFTVAGMVDRLVYSSLKHWEKKLEMGKLS